MLEKHSIEPNSKGLSTPASKNQAKKNPADSNSAGNNKQSKQSSNMTEGLLKSIKGQEIKIGKGQKIQKEK